MQKKVLLALLISCLITMSVDLTSKEKRGQNEQSGFSVEQELVPIEKPSHLPQEALQVLAKEVGVASCLENEGVSSDQLPSSWFIVSEIHLDGPNEVDLVVLPNLASKPQQHPGPAVCFLGANTGQFWIIRKTPSGYQLVLSLFTDALTVLDSRSKRLRDIEAVTVSVHGETTSLFKFNGEQYKLYSEKTENNAPQPNKGHGGEPLNSPWFSTTTAMIETQINPFPIWASGAHWQ